MANPEFPLINGVMYSWSSIKLEMLGAPVIGYTAINYGETDGKSNKYGQGRFPIGRTYGNVEPNASITMYKDALESLQKIAPNGRIQDIAPFDVTVAYVNRGGKFIKETLKNFEFTENKVEVNQGDDGIAVSIQCIISHVEWAA
jgi:hypothetical protein